MADEALGAMATESEVVVPRTLPSKSTEIDLELTGLTTGVLVLLAAVWCLLSHHVSSRSRYLNESGMACLLGLAAGWVLLAYRDRSNAGLVDGLLRFNSAAFFTYLLPPVIFYAGLSVEQRLFFSNLPSILSFGVLGTLVSFLLISAALYSLAGTTIGMGAQDCLALGAVFAATDSVAVLGLLDSRSYPQLFSLVFGEGIVNDATSVVLLGALARMARQSAAYANAGADSGGKFTEEGTDQWVSEGDSGFALAWRLLGNFGYLLLTSTCLGLAAGLVVAALLRWRVASQGPHHEVALVGLLSYLAYLAAEVLGLSAILSLFCCGVAVSHFALRNGDSNGTNSSGAPTPGVAGSLDVSAHNTIRGGLGSEPGAQSTHEGVPARGDGRVGAAAPAGALNEHEGRARAWYSSIGGGDDDEGPLLDGASRGAATGTGGGTGSQMLRALTAPASSLAARAFGAGGGKSCMSAAGASTTNNAFRSLSYVAEGLIFVYLGMDCLDPVRWEASYTGEVLWLVGLLLLLLLAARAASVIPLSMLHNLYAPAHQNLSGRDMLIIWWSGLMRGAVSVALVYLNFDTGDGSKPAPQPIITPRHGGRVGGQGWAHAGAGPDFNSSASARGLLHAHMQVRLLQAPTEGGMAGVAAEAATGNTANPDVAAALALAAALAEADELSARQHATLIVSTLLVVVASVLVVSTLTKPLLQAALEADPRKPPLKVLTEALFDPWVEATWRLQVALDRSYRRWTNTVGGTSNTDGDNEGGRGGGAGASADIVCGGPAVSRRVPTPSTPLAMITTHTIPMTSLGIHAGVAAGPAANATAAPGGPLGSKAVAERQVQEPPTSLAGSVSVNPEDFSALSRPRGGQLQQRSHAVAAAAAAGGSLAGPAVSGGVPCPPSPSPGAASLIAMLPYRTGQGREAAATAGASSSPGSNASGVMAGAHHDGSKGHGTSTAERNPRLRVGGPRRAGAAADERPDEVEDAESEGGLSGSGAGAAAAGTRGGTPN